MGSSTATAYGKGNGISCQTEADQLPQKEREYPLLHYHYIITERSTTENRKTTGIGSVAGTGEIDLETGDDRTLFCRRSKRLFELLARRCRFLVVTTFLGVCLAATRVYKSNAGGDSLM